MYTPEQKRQIRNLIERETYVGKLRFTKEGHIVALQSYFYRNGQTAQGLADQIARAFPKAYILSWNEEYNHIPKPSYFRVVFTIDPKDLETLEDFQDEDSSVEIEDEPALNGASERQASFSPVSQSEMIRRMAREGVEVKEIARYLGIRYQMVYQVVKKMREREKERGSFV